MQVRTSDRLLEDDISLERGLMRDAVWFVLA